MFAGNIRAFLKVRIGFGPSLKNGTWMNTLAYFVNEASVTQRPNKLEHLYGASLVKLVCLS
jgi:hypothetical protein